jgi:hypothetical protein
VKDTRLPLLNRTTYSAAQDSQLLQVSRLYRPYCAIQEMHPSVSDWGEVMPRRGFVTHCPQDRLRSGQKCSDGKIDEAVRVKLTLREGPQERGNQSEDRVRGCENIRKKPWCSYWRRGRGLPETAADSLPFAASGRG